MRTKNIRVALRGPNFRGQVPVPDEGADPDVEVKDLTTAHSNPEVADIQ